jgi:7,8-didemethyl-8-hydroxy-5-deazariboflavin synthase
MIKQMITYSPSYTIVPTYECFNRCTYCNFRKDPGEDQWMSLEDAERILKTLEGVTEILILSGEVHPQSHRRSLWFNHIYNLCELSLKLGFYPHTNAGILTFAEMAKLKEVNTSMGLMLEQITPKLLDNVHKYAPSKIPELRLEQLIFAGKLQIPFTTGLLLGIGENHQDRLDSLRAIATIHKEYHHIQEVILQPYSQGTKETFKNDNFDYRELPNLIAKARQILPSDIIIQIPPNLVKDSDWLIACINAGARDLGGISPKDEVNPDYEHFNHQELTDILAAEGWILTPRLPVYK